jgi:hypothetical protein
MHREMFCTTPLGTFATRRIPSIVGLGAEVYSEGAIIVSAPFFRGLPSRGGRCGENSVYHAGTIPSVRKARGDHDLWEEVPGAGTELAAAVFSIHQPGDDSLRTVLLESGMPVLPRVLPAAGR